VHDIEQKILARSYASPGRARAAIGRSKLSNPLSKRLLAMVEAWSSEPQPARSAGSPDDGTSRAPLIAGELARSSGRSTPAPSSQIRLATVFRAYRLLAELAEAEGAPLLDLMGDVQSYELSIRSEVSRRESHGSLEQEVGPVITEKI
jgi:hypothetical protein